MRLSRKDEHSITALLVLANQERNQQPMNLTELAAALEISTSYLEHLFGDLRKAGLIEGLRGVGGGYRLSRPPTQISLADILLATAAFEAHEGMLVPSTSTELPEVARQAWAMVTRKLRVFLEDLTLADFALSHSSNKKVREDSVSSYIATMFRPHNPLGD
jgi:Rrf2 family iron-sulfur cluster assembly transcriptional regulator